MGREIMSFESFESHCAQLLASGAGATGDGDNSLLFTAEGLGRGGAVRLRDFHVDGVVPITVEKGTAQSIAALAIRYLIFALNSNLLYTCFTPIDLIGQRLRVRVKKILPETKSVMLECVELEGGAR